MTGRPPHPSESPLDHLGLYQLGVRSVQGPAERVPRCLVCAAETANPHFEIENLTARVLVCTQCGLGRLHPMLDAAEISALYPDDYYGELLFATLRYCLVTDDRREALAFAENVRFQIRLSQYLRQGQTDIPGAWLPEESFDGEASPEDILAANPIGDPETVAACLADEITRVGTSHLALFMTIGNTDHEVAMTSIHRFGDEVVPLIEKAVGPLGGVNIPKPLQAAQ